MGMDQKMESMEVLLNARANHAELQNSVEILIAEKKHQKKAHQNLLNELDRKEKEFENLKIENYKIQNKVKKIEEENEELMLRLKIMQIDGRLKEMEILLRHKQSNDALQNNMDTLKDECDALQSKSDKMKNEYQKLQKKHERDRQCRAEEEDEKIERQYVLEQQLKQEKDAHSATMDKYIQLEDEMDTVHINLNKMRTSQLDITQERDSNMSALKTNIFDLNEEIKAKQQKLEYSHSRINELEDENKEYEQAMNELKLQIVSEEEDNQKDRALRVRRMSACVHILEGKEYELDEAIKTSECFSDQRDELKLHIQAMTHMIDCVVNENLNLWQKINKMEMQLENSEDNEGNNALYNDLIAMKKDYGIYRAERDQIRTEWNELKAKYKMDQLRFAKEEEEAAYNG